MLTDAEKEILKEAKRIQRKTDSSEIIQEVSGNIRALSIAERPKTQSNTGTDGSPVLRTLAVANFTGRSLNDKLEDKTTELVTTDEITDLKRQLAEIKKLLNGGDY